MSNVKLAPIAAWMPFIGATREGGLPCTSSLHPRYVAGQERSTPPKAQDGDI
jgi:hypothetical protein